MNPFSSTTSSDIELTAGDIINSGLDLMQALTPIILIGLGIALFYPLKKLIMYALGIRYYKTWDELTVNWTKAEKKAEISSLKKDGYATDRRGLDRYAQINRKYRY